MIKIGLMTILFLVIFLVVTSVLKNYLFEPIISSCVPDAYIKIVTGFTTIIVQLTVLYFISRYSDFIPFVNADYSAVLKFIYGALIAGGIILGSIFILSKIGVLSIKSTNYTFTTILTIVLFFSVLALFEEIVFRGIIQSALQHHFSFIVVIIVTSIIFVLPHLSNDGISILSLISIFLGGVILCILRYLSKDIIIPLGFHVVWNMVQGIFGLDVSGGKTVNPLFKSSLEGNELLTGGVFGVESSLVTVVLLLIATIILMFVLLGSKNILT